MKFYNALKACRFPKYLKEVWYWEINLPNERSSGNYESLDTVSNLRVIDRDFHYNKHQLITLLPSKVLFYKFVAKSFVTFTAFEAASWTLIYMALKIWGDFDWNISKFTSCYSPLTKSCDSAFNFWPVSFLLPIKDIYYIAEGVRVKIIQIIIFSKQTIYYQEIIVCYFLVFKLEN